MSTISFPGLSRVRDGFAEWRHQAQMQRELLGLTNRYLEDIGLQRGSKDYRPSVPFRLM